MNDPGEPFAMWNSGASLFLLPWSNVPTTAPGTSKAVVRQPVGDYSAKRRTPLIPANKVVHTLNMIAYVSGKNATL
eukprot:12899079-Prorocentrum_lima.AAC.1